MGLLDVFGFESLHENGLEQICINMANERLRERTRGSITAVLNASITAALNAAQSLQR